MQKMKFEVGDEVVVVRGDYYAITATGSKGFVVSTESKDSVMIKFYLKTGDPNEATTFEIETDYIRKLTKLDKALK